MILCPSCSAQCDETHKFCPACGFPISEVGEKPDELVGRELPGGYVIVELVGVGGMGRVYRGEQKALGRTVAIKVIHSYLLGDESAALRFITEARAASRLNHPNTVGVIDFGKTDDGQLYLVMEFLKGRDLARIFYEDGYPTYPRLVEILRQVLQALGEAHALSVIHRDLKPENVILEPKRDGQELVKVVDFGLAKLNEGAAGNDTGITRPGIVCGTPDYMAPEQGRGEKVDGRADLYAVGIMMFLLMTGKMPFEADSPTQVVLMHMTVPPPDPRAMAPERQIPDTLAEVCLRAIEKEADKRYQTAADFEAALVGASTWLRNSIQPSASVECGSCGAPNPAGQKFCGNCGSPLKTDGGVGQSLFPKEGRSSRRMKVASSAGFPLKFSHREDDMAWLADRRAEVQGTLMGARLVGDEGVGKTRLLEEFLDRASAEGDFIVEVGPDPWLADVSYWTLQQLMRQLATLPEDGGGDAEWQGASIEARQGLKEVFEISQDSNRGMIDPEQRRFLAAEALKWAFVRASQGAGGKRVVVAVEDLNRVDGASRNAISDAFAEPPLVSALVVATHLPGFEAQWGAYARARVLSGLPADGVNALLDEPLEADVLEQASRGSRGVPPMFVDQHKRFVKEGGKEPQGSVADVIIERVHGLARGAEETLQGLAIFGMESQRDVLLRFLDTSPEKLERSCMELALRGFITQEGDRVGVCHPLVREVVLASIPAGARRDAYARAIKASADQRLPLEVQALFATHAQDAFDALLLLEQAAGRARARGDVGGAVLALRRGLDVARREIFRGELDDPARAVLIFSRKLGEALCEMGNFTDADGVLREALDLAGPSGTERAKVLAAMAHVAHGRQREQDAQAFLREALDVADRSGAHELVRSLELLQADLAL